MKFKAFTIVGFIAILILATLGVLFSALFSKNSSPTNGSPSPTQIENQESVSVFPTPTIGESKEVEKEIHLLQNRQPLSDADTQVKNTLIGMQQPNADAIYSTDEYHIDYIQAFDEFQVEIDSTDVKKSMTDAVSWFMQQGMSHDGICKLPVTFYRSFQLKDKNIQVPPLADGC